MPSKLVVDAFVAQVVSGDHVGAIRDWYHEDAWIQEGPGRPRLCGRAVLMAREEEMLGRCRSVETAILGGPMVEDDVVAIRWRFIFHLDSGKVIRQEEVAWQRWHGERIAEEIFFYDPAQRTPTSA